MANTFFAAQGLEIGDSLHEPDRLDTARLLLSAGGDRLHLPRDVVTADAFSADARHEVVPVDGVRPGWRILDIGPDTVSVFRDRILDARTVVWNGPMGVTEFPPFAVGTNEIARALADAKEATTIVGGGDSAAALEQAGLADAVTHLSTGGGASLEMLAGRPLPGVTALQHSD
jgi:phosphoglycerate kinase